jgi:Amidase
MTAPVRGLLLAALLLPASAVAQNGTNNNVPTEHNEATVAQLQAEMASGRLTSEALTKEYIARIIALDQNGPGVNAVIQLNPDALALARNADALRRRGIVLGPLHGIPILLKDNIDTADKMQTAAGSFALVGTPALRDSTIAANLRAGGAVISRSGLTSALSSPSAAGPAAAVRPTIPTALTAIPAAPAPAQAPPCPQISHPSPLAPKPMAASSAPLTPTESSASSPPLASPAALVSCPYPTRRIPSVLTVARSPTPPQSSASFRAAPSTGVIPPPAAFPWAGKEQARLAQQTSPPTTPNS